VVDIDLSSRCPARDDRHRARLHVADLVHAHALTPVEGDGPAELGDDGVVKEGAGASRFTLSRRSTSA